MFNLKRLYFLLIPVIALAIGLLGDNSRQQSMYSIPDYAQITNECAEMFSDDMVTVRKTKSEKTYKQQPSSGIAHWLHSLLNQDAALALSAFHTGFYPFYDKPLQPICYGHLHLLQLF